MPTLSPSQYAAYQVGKEVDRVLLEQVQIGLKTNYMGLLSIPGLNLVEPKNDAAFDVNIEALAIEVIQGETGKAKRILHALQATSPNEYEKLKNAKAIRAAAVKTTEQNTGDYEFLGGSTVANALAGFFEWIGKLLQWAFGGFQDEMPSLMNTIATSAASNAVNDFKINLKEQKVDPDNGFGKEAVEKFAIEAEVKANLIPAPEKKTFNLAEVKIEGFDPNAKKVEEKPAEINNPSDKTQVTAAFNTHFERVGENIEKNIRQSLKGKISTQTEVLLTEAKKALVTNGTRLAQQTLDSSKALPADFEFQLIKATFKDMQSKIDPQDTKSVEQMNKINAEFDKPGATVISVTDAFFKKGDLDTSGLIYVVGKHLDASRENLRETLQKAKPDSTYFVKDPAAELAAKNAALAAIEAQRKNIKDKVARDLEKNTDPIDIQAKLTQGIRKKIEDDYPTDSSKHSDYSVYLPGTRYLKSITNGTLVGENTTWLAGYTPSIAARETLAKFISTNMRTIVGEEINQLFDKNASNFDVNDVTKKSMARFDTAFDEGIKNGTIPKVWEQHKKMVKDAVKASLRENLEKQKDTISGGLNLVASANTRELLSNTQTNVVSTVPTNFKDGHFVGPAPRTLTEMAPVEQRQLS